MKSYEKLTSKDLATFKMEDILGTNPLDNMIQLFENMTNELADAQSGLDNAHKDTVSERKKIEKLLASEATDKTEKKTTKKNSRAPSMPNGLNGLGLNRRDSFYEMSKDERIQKEYNALRQLSSQLMLNKHSIPGKEKPDLVLCLNCDIYFRIKRTDGGNSIFNTFFTKEYQPIDFSGIVADGYINKAYNKKGQV